MNDAGARRRFEPGVFTIASVILVALSLSLGGIPLGGSSATVIACIAILVFGLPHGALDLELIKREHAQSRSRQALTLALYLAVAGGMYTLWRIAPVFALIVFVVISIEHFSEDWSDIGHDLLAKGVAAALLAAPMLLHGPETNAIFVAITGTDEGRLVADLLLLIAPTSLILAAVGLVVLWQAGMTEKAAVGVFVLMAMTFLPPAVGFSLFFCLFHSPRHFRAGLAVLSWDRLGQWGRLVVPLTLAALGIVALLYASGPAIGLSAGMVAASFMALSILVAPHMAVPLVLSALSARGAKLLPSKRLRCDARVPR